MGLSNNPSSGGDSNQLGALGIGTVAFSALAGYAQSEAQNASVRGAADLENLSTNLAAEQRKEITARNLHRLEGSLRASSAARGVGGSASTIAIDVSMFENASLEQENIEINRILGIGSTEARARSQFTNPFLSAFEGGVAGFGMASAFLGDGDEDSTPETDIRTSLRQIQGGQT